MPSYRITLHGDKWQTTKHFLELTLEKTAKLNAAIESHKTVRKMQDLMQKHAGGMRFELSPMWSWMDDKTLFFEMASSFDMIMKPDMLDMTVKGMSKNGPMLIERVAFDKPKTEKREVWDIPYSERKVIVEKVVYDGRRAK